MKGMTYLASLLTSIIFFFGIAILFATLTVRLKKTTVKQQSKWDQFRKEEHQASFCTKKAFPSNLLLTFEKDKIPYVENTICKNYYDKVMAFEKISMVDLGAYTNLELKQQFGINHLKELISCEESFHIFLEELYRYAICLNEHYYNQEAIAILEYVLEKGGSCQKYNNTLKEIYDTIRK